MTRRTPEEIIANICETIDTLVTPGEVFEIKALNSKISGERNKHGYYNDTMQAAIDAHDHNTNGRFNMYIGLNPRAADLVVNNTLLVSSGTKDRTKPEYDAHDSDIARLRWLLIDIDPVNKKHGGANAQQITEAHQTTKLVRRWFIQHGCPAPHTTFSGNGYHLLYILDLPITRATDVHRLLLYLNNTFSTTEIKIDEKVFNPARVTRLYGTLNHNCTKPRLTILQKEHDPVITEEQLDVLLKECPTLAEEIAYRQGRISGTLEGIELAKLKGRAEEEKDPLAITPEIERALILWLVQSAHNPQAPGYEYFSAILPYLKSEHFNDDFHAVIFGCLMDYVGKYGTPPTLDILRSNLREYVTEINAAEEATNIAQFDELFAQSPDLSTLDWFRDHLNPALEGKAADLAYSRMLGAVSARDFAAADTLWLERWKGTDADDNYYGFRTLPELLDKNIVFDWLIDDTFVVAQPTAIGGKKKCLKTGVLCDLIVSLATSTPFLGHFHVPKARRVAFFSAESGEADIAHRFRAIQTARGASNLNNIFVSFKKPRLSDEAEISRIEAFCKKNQIEVLIIDPLYLTLLTGNKDSQPGNVFAMGDVYAPIGSLADKLGITPILCHHFKKTAGDTLDLDDFAFSGLAEWARQSLIIRRRAPFDTPANNQMQFRVHGFGRGDYYDLHVNEGTLAEPCWMTMVKLATQNHHDQTNAAEQRQNETLLRFFELEAAEDRTMWHSLRAASAFIGKSGTVTKATIQRLRNAELIEVSDDKIPKYRLSRDYHPPTPDDPPDAGLAEEFDDV